MECFVCGRRGRRRGFRNFQEVENVAPHIIEAATAARLLNNLPPQDFGLAVVIHHNCYRHILAEANPEDDDEEAVDNVQHGAQFNCVQLTRNGCFVCRRVGVQNMKTVNLQARVSVFLKVDLFIPKRARCCERHFDQDDNLSENVIANLRGIRRHVPLSKKEITDWFSSLRTAAINASKKVYETENHFSDDDFKILTRLEKNHFRDLRNYCDNVMVYERERRVTTKDLITFLIKITRNLSDSFLKVMLNYSTRQKVSLAVTSVLETLSRRFSLENVGLAAMPRGIFLDAHVTEFANALYNPNPENRVAILYVDGTYLKIEKSSNFRCLRQSYSVHKHYHLLKPALLVGSDGYILDVHGPYFADGRSNDAQMLLHELRQEQNADVQGLSNWLQHGDIIIVDRGYRDAVNFLQDMGVQSWIPPELPRGQTQLATLEANTARLITKTRWIVEARNGHLKHIFNIFQDTISFHYIPHIGKLLRIACGILNRYFPPLQMEGANVQLAEEMRELARHENVVRARVEAEQLHRQIIPNDRWLNIDEVGLPEFPVLDLQYLRDLTLGVYQLKLAPAYVQDKLQRENIEHFTLQTMLHEPGFLRCRLYSRFSQAIRHQIWIAFVPTGNNENNEDGPIVGYYCTCKTGSRTVGCCAHVASIIWFLGYARHEANVKYPPTKLLDCVLDAADRPVA